MPADFPTPPAPPPMPARMEAGLRALELLAGCLSVLGCLNLAGYFLVPGDSSLLLYLSPGAFLLLAFVLACRTGILRGYRIAAILVLLAPALALLSLPIVKEAFVLASAFDDKLPRILFLFLAWITRLLWPCMLVVLIFAWPLAFGATARAWYSARATSAAPRNPVARLLASTRQAASRGWIFLRDMPGISISRARRR